MSPLLSFLLLLIIPFREEAYQATPKGKLLIELRNLTGWYSDKTLH